MALRDIFNFGKPRFEVKEVQKTENTTSSLFMAQKSTDPNVKFSSSQVTNTVDMMLRQDSTISMIMTAYELTALNTAFRIESENQKTKEFLESVFFENPKWEFQTLLKMAFNAIKYGFTSIEYEVIKEGNLWSVGKIQSVNKVSDVVVEYDEVVSYNRGSYADKVKVDSNFVWLTRDRLKGIYGESFLRSAYKSFQDNLDTSEVNILRHTKAALGTPMLDTDGLQPDEVMAGTEALDSLRAVEISHIAMPKAKERISILTPSAPDTKIIESLENIRKTLASSYFCSFLIAGTTDNGSRSVADTQKAFFDRILDGLLSQIVVQLNEQLIMPLAFENFGTKAWLTFTPNDTTDTDSFLNRFKDLKTAGLLTYGIDEENAVREAIGLKQLTQRPATDAKLSHNHTQKKVNFSISSDKQKVIDIAVKRFNFKALEKNIILSKEAVTKLYESKMIPVLNDMLDQFEKQITQGKRIYTKDYTKQWEALYTELNKVAKESFTVGKRVASDALGVDIPSTDSLVTDNILAYVQATSRGLIDDLALYGTSVATQLELKSSDERNILDQIRQELQKRYDSAVEQASGNLPQLMLNAGQTYSYDKNGSKVNGFIWRVDLENKFNDKICGFCLGMENLIVRPDDPTLNTHRPPVHNNCACFWVPLRDSDTVLPEMYDEVPSNLETTGVSNNFQFSLFAKKDKTI